MAPSGHRRRVVVTHSATASRSWPPACCVEPLRSGTIPRDEVSAHACAGRTASRPNPWVAQGPPVIRRSYYCIILCESNSSVGTAYCCPKAASFFSSRLPHRQQHFHYFTVCFPRRLWDRLRVEGFKIAQ